MREKLANIYVKGLVKVKEFSENERGDIVQTSVILGILALLAIAVLTMLKTPITNVFNNIKTALTNMK